MSYSTTPDGGIMIKRSPVILIWKFAVIEAACLLLYVLAMALGDTKSQIYSQLSFSSVLSYQTAKYLFLSAAQFAVTIYAFLSWFYEFYFVSPDMIMYEHGILGKSKKFLRVNNATQFSILRSPLGKFFHYGTIRTTTGGTSLDMTYVSRPETFVGVIRRTVNQHEHAFEHEPDIHQLLLENEHERLEFKSSLRFDYKLGQATRGVEKSAMKTITAFLNSKGGHLVLGVNDARAALGLENDYQTLQRKDVDGFENHFTQTFNSMIGPEFRALIKLWFPKLDGHDLCIVQTLASPRPVYLKADNDEQFYVRTGNTSTSLKLSEIEAYSSTRWPRPAYED